MTRRRAWLDMLPAFRAEQRLETEDLSHLSMEQVYRLAMAATGDQERAREIKMAHYRARLDAKVRSRSRLER